MAYCVGKLAISISIIANGFGKLANSISKQSIAYGTVLKDITHLLIGHKDI